jgi:hypothetical protein
MEQINPGLTGRSRENLSLIVPVPKSIPIFFWSDGVNLLEVPLTRTNPGRIIGVAVTTNATDSGTFNIEILVNGSVEKTVTFSSGKTKEVFTVDVPLVPEDLVQVRMARATGSGKSTFTQVLLVLEIREL